MAPKCPHSANIKAFLEEAGVQVEERCILDNEDILQEMIDVSGQKAIPVTVMGEDVFVGFDRRIERRLKRRLEA
jgi:glutaredoxin